MFGGPGEFHLKFRGNFCKYLSKKKYRENISFQKRKKNFFACNIGFNSYDFTGGDKKLF